MSNEAVTVEGAIYYSAEHVGKLCEIHRQLESERIIKLLEEKSTHPQCRNQPLLERDGSPAWCLEGNDGCTLTLRNIFRIREG